MAGERVQRNVQRLLDEAEAAVALNDWQRVRDRCAAVLALDPDNPDAQA